MGSEQKKRESERTLYTELHRTKSLSSLLKVMFQIEGKLPAARKVAETFAGVHFFFFVVEHQSVYFFNIGTKKNPTDAAAAAWDLADEASYELLIACLLVRLRAIPQGMAHTRRALELTIEAAFLSTSYIRQAGKLWSPFAELYTTDLWQYYSGVRPLSFREVVDQVRARKSSVSDCLADFTHFYLEEFASRYCDTHFNSRSRELERQGLSSPIGLPIPRQEAQCKISGCKEEATKIVTERVPTFELMRETARARLTEVGYSKELDKTVREIYAEMSKYVHVTRVAHRHGPSWDRRDLDAWADVIGRYLPLASKVFTMTWRLQKIDMPGLAAYLDRQGYSFSNLDLKRVERPVCDILYELVK